MNDRDRALPLSAVLQVADARRRRRERVRGVAAPVAGVLAAGLAGAVVVAVQVGAATGGAIDVAAPPSTTSEPTVAATTTSAPPFDPSIARPGYMEDLATTLGSGPDGERAAEDAQALADAWGVPVVPDAQAITAKAAFLGETLALDDPAGGEQLAERFAGAGYTEDDAVALAAAWGTDPRTAAILGALVAEAG